MPVQLPTQETQTSAVTPCAVELVHSAFIPTPAIAVVIVVTIVVVELLSLRADGSNQ